MNNQIKLSSEQLNALEVMQSGLNVFCCGPGGTGKTEIIREFTKRNPQAEIVCLAPTGLAARQISGSTIHKLFRLPALPLNLINYATTMKQIRLLQTVDIIIVDEVSLLRSDVFAVMDYMLRFANNTDLPFGQKQIILIGDPLQLPPVVSDLKIEMYLNKVFGGVHFFNTACWKAAGFHNIVLENIYRQDDNKFKEILNSVRLCDSNIAKSLDILNKRVLKPILDKNKISLCTRNEDADIINQTELDKVDGDYYAFTADIRGNFPIRDLPVEAQLYFKIGSRVMILSNGINYVNGDIGTVVEVDCCYGPSVTVRLDKQQREVMIKRNKWDNYEYDLVKSDDGELHIISTEIGTAYQFPLRLANAMSIHKGQGQTFENVHLVLGKSCFVAGQLYTGLSRVKSMEGLSLDRPIEIIEANPDDEVKSFYESISKNEVKKQAE